MTSDDDPTSEEQIRVLVARLSRSRRGGGREIERAAIMAEGTNSAAILEWITKRSWAPEEAPEAPNGRGGSGMNGMRRDTQALGARAPRRYVSPPGDTG